MAIAVSHTLTFMPATKRLDARHAESLAKILRPIVRERFGGNETAFAKTVGVSQSQMNSILKGEDGERSVGINVLLRLRAYLRISLDEMLGLPPLGRSDAPTDLEEAVMRALDRRFPDGTPGPGAPLPPTPSKPRKGREA